MEGRLEFFTERLKRVVRNEMARRPKCLRWTIVISSGPARLPCCQVASELRISSEDLFALGSRADDVEAGNRLRLEFPISGLFVRLFRVFLVRIRIASVLVMSKTGEFNLGLQEFSSLDPVLYGVFPLVAASGGFEVILFRSRVRWVKSPRVY